MFGIVMYNIRLMCGIYVLYMYSIAWDKPVYLFKYIYIRSYDVFLFLIYMCTMPIDTF